MQKSRGNWTGLPIPMKKLVILLGTKKALSIAIKNNKSQKRYTLLKERLNQS